MKPIKLTMKAFGSYANETTVDFASFTGGLYLIVGKTGAGKTTIFDAISFALFGVPSGSDRTADMLHSDFVNKSVDTVVTLSFLHQKRIYCIERSIHFRKKRGGEGYSDGVIDAAMTGEQEVLEGAQRVTKRCEELLGLNADQFRRIVMLAQGEFREFLKAPSDKKNEILGKLFDNTEYLRFQTLLESVRKALDVQRSSYESEIATVMEAVFFLPMDEEHPEKYLVGNPQLVDNLRALTEADEALLAQRQAESDVRNEAVNELTRREGAAEAANALLEELAQRHARLESLQGQAEQIAAQAKEYCAAERALHTVKPCADALSRAEQALLQTRTEIESKETLLRNQQAALADAQRVVEEDAPKRTQIDHLTEDAAKLRDALPRYDELTEETALLTEQQKALAQAQERSKALDGQQTAQAEALGSLRKELKALEGCEAEEVRLSGELGDARTRFETVAAPDDGISAQTDMILQAEGTLTVEEGTLKTLTADAAKAELRHHELYQLFLSGQAGLIAVNMEQELAETGRTVCPVCNTAFCSSDTHRFALPVEHVPVKRDVEKAEESAKMAERLRQDKQTYIETQRELLAQKKEMLVSAARKIDPDCSGWGSLTAPGYLSGLRLRLERRVQEAEAAWNTAKERSDRRKRLLQLEPEQVRALEELETQRSTTRDEIEELRRSIHGAESAIALLQAQLAFPDKVAAQAQLDSLTAQRTELQRMVTAHEQDCSTAKEALDGTEGGLRTLRAALPRLEQEADHTRATLAQKLEEAGFSDLSVATAALLPIGCEDGERWLMARKQTLDDYARDVENTSARIGELEEQTAGKQHVDMEALKAELLEAADAQRAALERLSEQRSVLSGHKSVLEQVSKAKSAIAGTDRAYSRISRLAALAIGASSDVGKLSFDRYVMGAIFWEVLEHANRRLDIMTGGRFALIHVVDAGRKNSIAGLEVEVLDRETGRQRASGSISGGEGFLVSLSLALGLSDVVQSHAGGQKLDTLFIDEGFGTLDDGKLDSVIGVLQQLTEGNRLVGVISHVDKLEESIPQKLRVSSGPHGSTLELELS